MRCARAQSSWRPMNKLPSKGMKNTPSEEVKVPLFLVVFSLKQQSVMLGGCYQ